MNEKYIGKTCPYCKTAFTENDDIVICSACDMPHHKDCWIENQGCTTFGCSGTIEGLSNEPNSVTMQQMEYTQRPGYGQPQRPAYQQPPQPQYGYPQQPAYGQPQRPAYQQPYQQPQSQRVYTPSQAAQQRTADGNYTPGDVAAQPRWHCPSCGASVNGNTSQCTRCGTVKPF